MGIARRRQLRLEPARLLDVEGFEVASAIVLFEALDGDGSGVDGRLVAALRVLEIKDVAALNALVVRMSLAHGFLVLL